MGTDQRKSFRILVPIGQDQAVLKIGLRSAPVRLIDASAGGFAVASPDPLHVKRGDVLQLRTNAGWHEIRVVRLESFSDGVLIGVERLRDIDDPRGPTAVRVFTVGAVAAAILAGFVWLLIHDRPSQAEATILPPASQIASKDPPPQRSLPAPGKAQP